MQSLTIPIFLTVHWIGSRGTHNVIKARLLFPACVNFPEEATPRWVFASFYREPSPLSSSGAKPPCPSDHHTVFHNLHDLCIICLAFSSYFFLFLSPLILLPSLFPFNLYLPFLPSSLSFFSSSLSSKQSHVLHISLSCPNYHCKYRPYCLLLQNRLRLSCITVVVLSFKTTFILHRLKQITGGSCIVTLSHCVTLLLG